ncbi:hypothetical protein BHE74_00050657, partial [Ensete ventricosum]
MGSEPGTLIRHAPESAARDDKCRRQGFLEMDAEHPEGIASAAGDTIREIRRFYGSAVDVSGVQLATEASEGGENYSVVADRANL